MGKCLWCGDNFFPRIRWMNLVDVEHRRGFCDRCMSKFDRLTGPKICQKCGRDLELLSPAFVKDGVCTDCLGWGDADILAMNRSLFTYTPFLREVVTRFKFRGDAILVEGFRDAWRELYLRHFKKCLPIPIPLSTERMAERHFNQAWILASLLPTPPVDLLIRVKHDTKQSKKSRHERLASEENPFILCDDVENFRGSPFVIIDDIYTTGTTVRHAASALKALDPVAIYSMTLAR